MDLALTWSSSLVLADLVLDGETGLQMGGKNHSDGHGDCSAEMAATSHPTLGDGKQQKTAVLASTHLQALRILNDAMVAH